MTPESNRRFDTLVFRSMVPPLGCPSVIATVLPEIRPVAMPVAAERVVKSYWALEPEARSR